jgi:hypothetical protein
MPTIILSMGGPANTTDLFSAKKGPRFELSLPRNYQNMSLSMLKLFDIKPKLPSSKLYTDWKKVSIHVPLSTMQSIDFLN